MIKGREANEYQLIIYAAFIYPFISLKRYQQLTINSNNVSIIN